MAGPGMTSRVPWVRGELLGRTRGWPVQRMTAATPLLPCIKQGKAYLCDRAFGRLRLRLREPVVVVVQPQDRLCEPRLESTSGKTQVETSSHVHQMEPPSGLESRGVGPMVHVLHSWCLGDPGGGRRGEPEESGDAAVKDVNHIRVQSPVETPWRAFIKGTGQLPDLPNSDDPAIVWMRKLDLKGPSPRLAASVTLSLCPPNTSLGEDTDAASVLEQAASILCSGVYFCEGSRVHTDYNVLEVREVVPGGLVQCRLQSAVEWHVTLSPADEEKAGYHDEAKEPDAPPSQDTQGTAGSQAYRSLMEMVRLPLTHGDVMRRLGAEGPKGILFCGPPGVGKTWTVRQVAKELRAKLLLAEGSTLFGAAVGEAEAQLRALFKEAAEHEGPCILFVDEIRTGAGQASRVVAQLLTLLDGAVKRRSNLVVVGATNRSNAIDAALRRPGRFDREVVLNAPDAAERLLLLQHFTRGVPLAKGVDLRMVASRSIGFVGADLEALVRRGVRIAVRQRQQLQQRDVRITQINLLDSLRRITPSLQRGFSVRSGSMSLDDVGGLEQVKKELYRAVLLPLRKPGQCKRLGIRAARGVLLYGPPGTGKTSLSRALANTASLGFFMLGPADVFNALVGEAEKTIIAAFRRARANAPCILFFDEVDSILGSRDTAQTGNGLENRLLTTMLTEMDGVAGTGGVTVLGSTNRPTCLDPALLRPGRFDHQIEVPLPDAAARLAILGVKLRSMAVSHDVRLDVLVDRTDDWSGADLENLCRESAIIALRRSIDARSVTQADFLSALSSLQKSRHLHSSTLPSWT